jgi:hypothetical protein
MEAKVGFQLKGGAKRQKISANDEISSVSDGRQIILGIENSVIAGVQTDSVETPLIIPLIPPKKADASGAKPVIAAPVLRQREWAAERSGNDLDSMAADEIMKELQKVKPIEDSGLVIAIDQKEGVSSISVKKAPLLMAGLAPELLNVENDDERFKIDLSLRADDMNFRSEIYEAIPVEQFGAALLRGMGWKGPSVADEEIARANEKPIIPRDKGLGLGATPKPGQDMKNKSKSQNSSASNENWSKTIDKKLKSQRLYDGDLVWLRDPTYASMRAKVIATSGVPGLDKIR